MGRTLCSTFWPETHTQHLRDKWSGFDNATAWALVWSGVASYGGGSTDGLTVFIYASGAEGAEKLAAWHADFPHKHGMGVLQWLVFGGHVPVEAAVRAMDRIAGLDPLEKADVLEAAVFMLRGLGREAMQPEKLARDEGRGVGGYSQAT